MVAEAESLRLLRVKYPNELTAYAPQAVSMWKTSKNWTLLLSPDFFSAASASGNWYFYPLGSKEKKCAFVRDLMEQRHPFSLNYLRWRDVLDLQSWFQEMFRFYPDSDGSEYIYSTAALANPIGGGYRDYRRKIHNVEGRLNTESDFISEAELPILRSLVGACLEKRGDMEATLYALEHYTDLQYQGLCLRSNGLPAAFILGYENTSNTFTLCSAKNFCGLSGITHKLIFEFCRRLQSRYPYLNLEEDLGIAGIRAMKSRLCPLRKNEVWRAEWIC